MFKIKDAWQIVEEVSTEGTWTDVRDGQVYPYKQIGDQIWMTQNLNYGGLAGDWVPHTTAQSEGHAWRYQDQQNYNNFPFERGALYTKASFSWAVPEGWHIPSKAEIETLASYLDSEYGNHIASAKLNTNYWCGAGAGTNDSGLSLVPTGNWSGSNWNACNQVPPESSSQNFFYAWTSSFVSGEINYTWWVYSGWEFASGSSSTINNIAQPIRLIKDSGVYVPQPAISTITTTLDSTGSDNKIATEKATRTAITDATSSKMSNPMNAGGQMISGATNGTPTAISSPSAGQVMIGFYVSGAPYVMPQWHNANESIIWGMPWTTKGSLVYAGDPYASAESQFLSGKNKLESLPIGNQGQVLAVNSSAVPAWTDPELPSIENYSLSLTDSVQESATENENKVHFSKVYCHTSKKVTRMGFFHKSGIQGVVGLGIYNASGTALVTTAITGLTSATEGDVCWVDLLGPVTLTRGTVYWFAFFTGWASGEWNTNIQFARNTSINGVGNTMIITYSLGSGTTSMPSSITSTTEGQFVPWIVAD